MAASGMPQAVASFARLDAFAGGEIIGLAKAGRKAADIRKPVVKKDWRRPIARAVRDTVAKWKANPQWRGENPPGPGRKRLVDPALEKRMVRLVFKESGSEVVTIFYMRRKFPSQGPRPHGKIMSKTHST